MSYPKYIYPYTKADAELSAELLAGRIALAFGKETAYRILADAAAKELITPPEIFRHVRA